MGFHCDIQVKKAGALDASAVEDDAEMASVAQIRKPLWITVGIIIFMGFFVWPLLTLPAGDFRYVFDLKSLPWWDMYAIQTALQPCTMVWAHNERQDLHLTNLNVSHCMGLR